MKVPELYELCWSGFVVLPEPMQRTFPNTGELSPGIIDRGFLWKRSN
jgi:hypothetical protein